MQLIAIANGEDKIIATNTVDTLPYKNLKPFKLFCQPELNYLKSLTFALKSQKSCSSWKLHSNFESASEKIKLTGSFEVKP